MMKEEKKITGKKIYDADWIKLYEDVVTLSNNSKKYIRTVIKHIGAVCILAICDDNNIILTEQYRYPIKQYSLEIPAGKININESLLEAAIRECAEETGYIPEKINKIMEFYSAPGFCDEKLTLFKAENLKQTNKYRQDEDENITLKKYTKEEILLLLEKNIIKDAKTIIALNYWVNNE